MLFLEDMTTWHGVFFFGGVMVSRCYGRDIL